MKHDTISAKIEKAAEAKPGSWQACKAYQYFICMRQNLFSSSVHSSFSFLL